MYPINKRTRLLFLHNANFFHFGESVVFCLYICFILLFYIRVFIFILLQIDGYSLVECFPMDHSYLYSPTASSCLKLTHIGLQREQQSIPISNVLGNSSLHQSTLPNKKRKFHSAIRSVGFQTNILDYVTSSVSTAKLDFYPNTSGDSNLVNTTFPLSHIEPNTIAEGSEMIHSGFYSPQDVQYEIPCNSKHTYWVIETSLSQITRESLHFLLSSIPHSYLLISDPHLREDYETNVLHTFDRVYTVLLKLKSHRTKIWLLNKLDHPNLYLLVRPLYKKPGQSIHTSATYFKDYLKQFGFNYVEE